MPFSSRASYAVQPLDGDQETVQLVTVPCFQPRIKTSNLIAWILQAQERGLQDDQFLGA